MLMKLLKLLTAFSALALLAFPALADEEKKDTSANAAQQPTAPVTPVTPEIKWHAYDVGLAKAKKEGKHVFIDFTAKWCGYCKKMDKTTFIEPEIVKLLNNDFVSVQVDGDSEKELNIDGYKVTEKNLSRLEYQVRGFPTFWFLDSQGARLGNLQGYQQTAALLGTLQYVKDKKYVTEQKPEDKKPAPDKN